MQGFALPDNAVNPAEQSPALAKDRGIAGSGSGLRAPGEAWAHGKVGEECWLEIAHGVQRVRIPPGNA